MKEKPTKEELAKGTNPVPFYHSTKKTLGVIFSIAILIGGIYAIYRDPSQTTSVLTVWSCYGGTLLGIKTMGGVMKSNGGNEL